ncbi:DUF1318 [Desulfonema limicola]|uniref:DUF1318 n=1 Tax=Desulfonema limicola TaxID=45656 RepID=A0A975B7X7_9BACT|nr:DUF1318 domain-containing protein [Desulfonema limicola]QTA80391.1 DUF1318 [Desulfonema limicola]
MRPILKKIIFSWIILLTGCTLAKVNVEVISERTSLENQILGTYNALDNEMLMAASVRGVDPRGNIKKPPRHSQEHKDAVTALQVQAFHEYDITRFKQIKWAGENNQGLLTPFKMDKNNIPGHLSDFAQRFTQQEFDAIIFQVNQAREIIMQRVIDMNENLSKDDIQEIRKTFGKLNRENALAGEKVQNDNQEWVVKK